MFRKNRGQTNKTHFVSTENMKQSCAGIELYPDTEYAEGIKFQEADILIANIRPYLKKAWLATFSGACSADVLALCPVNILPSFLYSVISRDSFFDYVMSGAKGSKMPRGDKTHIMAYSFGVPGCKEQKRISDMIAWLDKRIDSQRRLVEALKSYKRGALSKLFPKKGASEPEVRLSGFTGEWEQRKFQETVIIERGGSPRPIENFITEAENGLNWVKIGDAPAMGNYITKTAEKIRPEGLHYTREVHPGDLILSNSMSFGKPYIMGINGCIHDGWLLIRNENDTYDLDFLCHLLGAKHMLDQYKSLAAGSAVNNLNKELVGSTIVSYPGIQEQKAIGNLLTSLDSLIALHQKNVVNYEKVKHGLIQELFI